MSLESLLVIEYYIIYYKVIKSIDIIGISLDSQIYNTLVLYLVIFSAKILLITISYIVV
jgi:hypothetical protein